MKFGMSVFVLNWRKCPRDLLTNFYATCTNLDTGKPEYIRLRDMNAQIDYMRASTAMAYMAHIVEFDGTSGSSKITRRITIA